MSMERQLYIIKKLWAISKRMAHGDFGWAARLARELACQDLHPDVGQRMESIYTNVERGDDGSAMDALEKAMDAALGA